MASPAAHRLLLLLLAACMISAGLRAQKMAAKKESAEAIVARVEQPYAGIADYTVNLDVNVDIQGLTIPPVRATMYFKQPDKVHFKAEGFAILPREAAAFGLGRLRSLNTVEQGVAREAVEGLTKLRVSLIPKADKSGRSRVVLYVDPDRWTADRAVSLLPDGRTVTAIFRYERQDSLWLPSSLDLSFSSLSADGSSDLTILKDLSPDMTARSPREGKVSIRYSNYRINTGLHDDIFTKPDGQESAR